MNILTPARERLTPQQFRQFERDGSLVLTQGQARPRYFDGRFLDARSLIQEQTYFLTRQAIQGRAHGAGVVLGLRVSAGSATSLRITSGQGVTPTGEIVVVDQDLLINLDDVATFENLAAAFGLRRIPAEPPRARSGLFIVALRAVEFTANPVASFPASAGGERTVQDGDIIEATAVSLVPYPEQSGEGDFDRRRSLVAREIFVDDVQKGVPAGALPLAMVALQAGSIAWVDEDMVRRSAGSESPFAGLGVAPRALREAHYRQFDGQLDDVLALRQGLNRGLRFAAAEHFAALPPAGRLPSAAVDSTEFTQIFFPPEMDVDLSITPVDEIAGLVEDSLLLPPIDLQASKSSLESTSVLIMIPVARAAFEDLVRGNRLPQVIQPLKSAVPGVVSLRRPVEALQLLRAPREPEATGPPDDDTGAVWREALAQSPILFYIRRREIPFSRRIATVPVVAVEAVEGGVVVPQPILDRLRPLGLDAAVLSTLSNSERSVSSAAIELLSRQPLANSLLLSAGAATEITSAPTLTATRFNETRARFEPLDGRGVARIAALNPDLASSPELIQPIAASGVVVDLERAAASAPDSLMAPFVADLGTAARSRDTGAIRALTQRLAAGEPRPPAGPDNAARVEERMRELGQLTRFRAVISAGPANVADLLVDLFVTPVVFDNPLLIESALTRFESAGTLTVQALRLIVRAHTTARVGEGLLRLAALEAAYFTNRRIVRTLGESGQILRLDATARDLAAAALAQLSARLLVAARAGDVDAVRALLT